MNIAHDVAKLMGTGPGTAGILLVVAALLVGATIVRGVAYRLWPNEQNRGRLRSIGTWWILAGLLAVILVLGRPAAVVVMAAISLLALREGLELAGCRRCLPWLAGVAVVVYLWAWLDWVSLFTRALPVLAGALVLAEAAWRARRRWRRPGLAAARTVVVAFLVTVVGPSFVVAVASLSTAGDAARGLGLVVLLLFLTALNDMAQAWFGRGLGAHALAPRLSPAKTWEGFYGGLATTVVAAVVLTPLVLAAPSDTTAAAPSAPVHAAGPLWPWSALLGLLVGLAGVAGDLTASALKRRAGADDSGDLLPGHGGVLDRLDSLALTGPVFFVFVVLFVTGGLP